MTRPNPHPTHLEAVAHAAASVIKGRDRNMTEFLAGAVSALLVIAALNWRNVWWHITEEFRYRRGGIRVWWVLRQERKAKEAP